MANSSTYFWTQEKRKELIEKYPNTPKQELLNIFSTQTWKNICDTAQRLGASRLNYYKNNETPKSGKISNLLNKKLESLYWIGFLLADAYICEERGRIQIQLNKKDLTHLEAFCKYINHTGKLKNWNRTDKNNKLGYSEAIKIDFQDKVNVLKLVELFKFKTPKTYNPPQDYTFLSSLTKEEFINFLAGYIDGDGTINKQDRIIIKIHSSWKPFLDFSINKLNKDLLIIDKGLKTCIYNNYPQFAWLSIPVKVSRELLKYRQSFWLKRKWDNIHDKKEKRII